MMLPARRVYGGSPPRVNGFLGWPSLVFIWTFILWFAVILCRNAKAPLHRENVKGTTKLEATWYFVLWSSVVPQLVFFCVYGTWLGWKFFMHN